jgi:NDP-sugar pyrophosphorylase family protein
MNCPALIMAGGKSERMRAGGCVLHKALRAICGAPLIEYNLEMLFRFGVSRVWVAVSSAEEQLLSWLNERGRCVATEARAELCVIVEHEPLGTIGAAKRLGNVAENVLVINVDNLTGLDLNALLDCQIRNRAALTVATHSEQFRIPFGEVEREGSRLIAYREKPEINITISSGMYVLHQRAMRCIADTSPTSAPVLAQRLLEAGEAVACYHHNAWWIDVNDEAALARAEALIARQSPLRCPENGLAFPYAAHRPQ